MLTSEGFVRAHSFQLGAYDFQRLRPTTVSGNPAPAPPSPHGSVRDLATFQKLSQQLLAMRFFALSSSQVSDQVSQNQTPSTLWSAPSMISTSAWETGTGSSTTC